MGGPSREALVRAVRRLPTDEHAALRAALRRERDGQPRVSTADGSAVGDAPNDDRSLAPAETVRALLYAVDRRTADRLCRRHLGRPLAALYSTGSDSSASDGNGRWTTLSVCRMLSTTGRRVGAVVSGERATVLVVVVVVLAMGVAAIPTREALSADAGPVERETTVATPVPLETLEDRSTGAIEPVGGGRQVSEDVIGITPDQRDDGSRVTSGNPTGEDFPASLTADGVTTAGELASVHALAVADRSYVWRVTYRERTGDDVRSVGGVRAVRWETVRVERPGRYRTTVTGWGSLAARSAPISSVEAFGDGGRRFVRRDEGNATIYGDEPVLRDGSGGRYALRASRLVRWHVAGEPTRITSSTSVGDRTYYLVYAGEGYDSATPETWLTVDDEGMVHAFHTRYPVDGSNVTAVVSFEYTDVGTTAVEPPTWYGEAIERPRAGSPAVVERPLAIDRRQAGTGSRWA